MGNLQLHERGSLVSSEARDGVFPIRIITEGEGSSGVYSRQVLEQYKDVFANRPMFMNHPKDPSKPWERDIMGIAARTAPEVEYREENGLGALYTKAHVRKEFIPFIEEYGDLIGVSVYIAGSGEEKDGKVQVESFDGTDPYASVDFVVAAGRGGRIERAVESFRAIEASIGNPVGNGTSSGVADIEERENKMDPELKALIESSFKALGERIAELDAKIEAVKTLSESAAAERTQIEDAFEVADEVSKAVLEAKLPEEGRKRVVEAVKTGKTVAEAVKSESDYIEAIRKEQGEQPGAPVAGRVITTEGASGEFSLGKLSEAA